MEERILSNKKIRDIYDRRAAGYDWSLWLFRLLGFRIRTYRKIAVERLHLTPGDTVVDLGCGTGLNFGLLEEQIGPEGTIVGVDLSESMLRKARWRIDKSKWENITLVCADMSGYSMPPETDAVLSTLALTMAPDYDEIIERAANTLDSGKRLSIFELKKPELWPAWLVHAMIVLLKTYGTRPAHAERTPWFSVQKHFSKFQMDEYYFGAAYVATGTM